MNPFFAEFVSQQLEINARGKIRPSLILMQARWPDTKTNSCAGRRVHNQLLPAQNMKSITAGVKPVALRMRNVLAE